jgi:RNA polymerase sigma-70 factor (ECF subfamily)
MTEPTPSFGEFYAAHDTALVRSLTRVTRCPLEAEEIAHDAFLALWRRWDRLGHVEDLEAYLYRAAMNVFRKRYRRRVIASPVEPTVPDAIASVEVRHQIDDAIRGLAWQQRKAVTLVDLLGFSAREAGELLGLDASTVRVHLSRARRHLRESLVTTWS